MFFYYTWLKGFSGLDKERTGFSVKRFHFVNEIYKHCKAIAGDGVELSSLRKTFIIESLKKNGRDDTAIFIDKS
jgi:hypothetical protein